jgi:hypothetical protein
LDRGRYTALSARSAWVRRRRRRLRREDGTACRGQITRIGLLRSDPGASIPPSLRVADHTPGVQIDVSYNAFYDPKRIPGCSEQLIARVSKGGPRSFADQWKSDDLISVRVNTEVPLSPILPSTSEPLQLGRHNAAGWALSVGPRSERRTLSSSHRRRA